MKKRFKTDYKREQQIKKMQRMLQILNAICAFFLSIIFFMYFCDFFNLDIDGDIQNRISGFKLSFLLLGNSLQDSNNILSLINDNQHGKIVFAAMSSCLTLFTLIGLIGLFIYRAVKKKPLFSKVILIILSVLFIAFIIQSVACISLAAYVEQYYYASCVTCRAQSLSHIPLLFFIFFMIGYFCLSYWLYNKDISQNK